MEEVGEVTVARYSGMLGLLLVCVVSAGSVDAGEVGPSRMGAGQGDLWKQFHASAVQYVQGKESLRRERVKDGTERKSAGPDPVSAIRELFALTSR